MGDLFLFFCLQTSDWKIFFGHIIIILGYIYISASPARKSGNLDVHFSTVEKSDCLFILYEFTSTYK